MIWNLLRSYVSDFARLPAAQHTVFIEQANVGGTLNGPGFVKTAELEEGV